MRIQPRRVTFVRQLLAPNLPRSNLDAGRERRRQQVFVRSATWRQAPQASGQVFEDAK